MANDNWPYPWPWSSVTWDAAAPPWRQPPHPFYLGGWQCICGRVFNPQVTECPYCPAQKPADVDDSPAVVVSSVGDPPGTVLRTVTVGSNIRAWHDGTISVAPCPHPAEHDLCLTDGECVPVDEGGTCTGGRHCGC